MQTHKTIFDSLPKSRLFVLLFLAMAHSLCAFGGEKVSCYLFAYFTDNSTQGQQVSYAVSKNGLDFVPLNGGKPVLASDTISLSGGVRDPHILRGDDGWFRMVLTDMDWQKGKWSNHGIVLLRSKDLVHWEHHTIDFHTRYAGEKYAAVNAVWAPQTIYDPQAGKYLVYFSLHSADGGPFERDAVHYVYASDDFSAVEGTPQLLFDYPDPTIDTDIVWRDGQCHIFFNTWGKDGLLRRQFIGTDLHRPSEWTLIPGRMQPNDLASEGSTAYPLIGSTDWILCYDCHRDGIFQFCRTPDLQHFTLERSTKATGTFTPRHGSVIHITEKEYEQLVKAFGM